MADEAGVRRLMAMYCQLLDDQRLDEWADLYTSDTVLIPNGPPIEGRDAVRAWAHSRFGSPAWVAKHLIANALIDIDGHRAIATSDFTVVTPSDHGLVVALAGRYEDELVFENRRWLYARHSIVVSPEWLPKPVSA